MFNTSQSWNTILTNLTWYEANVGWGASHLTGFICSDLGLWLSLAFTQTRWRLFL